MTYHFENTFAPLNGENIIRIYECQEGCSACCGPKTSIALTNTRIISRFKQPNKYCGCIEGAHVDTTVFLNDIELIREEQQETLSGCGLFFAACLTCTCICVICAVCCASCCGDRPKALEIKGGFHSEHLTFKTPDIPSAANEITSLIVPIKSRK